MGSNHVLARALCEKEHGERMKEHDRAMKELARRIAYLVSGFGEFMRRERRPE